MSFSEADQRFMRRALRLATRGRGAVEPNPMVGCVIVRDGEIIDVGWHRRFGGPHAEVHALRRCGDRARGADAFVTLEPCCHFGKTPPCTHALIGAGLARVVAAMRDPFHEMAGKGLEALRQAGIRAECGLLARQAEELNAPYLKLRQQGRPWVILKWAQSIDGKIADAAGRSKWISGEPGRRLVHRWRGQVDAVLVGIGTVLADDPLLTARLVRPRRVGARIVLDTRLRLPAGGRLARSAAQSPVLLVTSRAAAHAHAGRRRRLERRGVEVLPMRTVRGRIDPAALLDELGRRQMSNVLVEGGGEVLGDFLARGLADEARVFVSPRLIGGRDAPSALSGPGRPLGDAFQIKSKRVGQDLLYTIRFQTDTAT